MKIQPATPFAEVTESSISSWRAQCWQWDVLPAHGSLLAVQQGTRTIYGIVHGITTGPLDAQRTVFAYKKTEEQLKQEHPHIFELLASTISCITLGYKEDTLVRYQMAPVPPKIHAFVTSPSEQELQLFFKDEQYLHTLFAHADTLVSLDDLLLALIEQMIRSNSISKQGFARFINTFSLLTANDYRRLKLFLQRVQPLIQDTSLCLPS